MWREANVGWEEKNERKGPRASQNRPDQRVKNITVRATLQI